MHSKIEPTSTGTNRTLDRMDHWNFPTANQRHMRIFVTPCSFYVLLQSDGKARCLFGIKMPAEWQNFIENPNCPVVVLDWAGMYLPFWGMRQARNQKWFLKNDFLLSCNKTHFHKTGFALSLVLKVKGLELGHGLYATTTFPIIHLACPPKFCISIVFDFSWDGCNTQEKWKTKLLQNFGRQIICIMGNVEVANWKNKKRHSHVPVCVPVLLIIYPYVTRI